MQIPEELNKSIDEIREEMLAQISDEIDKTQGSFIWDAISPIAIKLADVYIQLQEILKRAFVQTSYSEYLDLKAKEYGIERKKATKATGNVIFEGKPGTIIPAGTIVTTIGDTITEAITFKTTEQVVIGDSGRATASVEAQEAGKKGNVPANAITLLGNYISGISRVYNPTPTSGGTDEEDDESLRQRILFKVQETLTGSALSDYKKWALEVDGVGRVQVIPCRYGRGTVGIYILDSNLDIPSDALIESVQNYLSPRYRYLKEAELFEMQGYGVTIVDLEDDSGSSVKMEYSSQGNGVISLLLGFLDREGVWQARVRIKVNDKTNDDNLVRIRIEDENGKLAYRSPLSPQKADYIFRAKDLEDFYKDIPINFYYSGNTLNLKIERLSEDIDTIVYIDYVEFVSLFGKDTGEGKVPIGACVYVEKPQIVDISIACRVVLKQGYFLESVKNDIENRIKEYFKEIALTGEEVSYAKVSGIILGTKGIYDVLNLRINNGIGNINLEKYQVPNLKTLEVTA